MAAGGIQGDRSELSIDELTALGEEIAALARVGVPLEAGLADLGRETPGRLRERFESVHAALVRGESIDLALADPRVGFSPLAQGVVAAGVRANRLADAVTGLVDSARLRAELRRLTGLALIYPLGVILVAYAGIALNLHLVVPQIVDSYRELHVEPPGWLRLLESFQHVPGWLWAIPPLVAIGIVAWWWIEAGRARTVEPAWNQRLLSSLPGVRKLLRDSESAAFADLTALLLESGAPLHEAVRLAGRATSNRDLSLAAVRLADELERGVSLPVAATSSDLPPLLRWLMSVGESRGTLTASLRDAARHYADQARRRADWFEVVMPLVLVLGGGGLAVITSSLLLLVPWVALLRQVADAPFK